MPKNTTAAQTAAAALFATENVERHNHLFLVGHTYWTVNGVKVSDAISNLLNRTAAERLTAAERTAERVTASL